MKNDGYQSHSIPCEGYPTWKITWDIISGVPFKMRTGFNFKEIQNHEHINNYDEILCLIKYFYKQCDIKFSYPLFFTPLLEFVRKCNIFQNQRQAVIKKFLNEKK